MPSLWKKSIISPVLKNKTQTSLNDFRPVALTSFVLKCFEKIELKRLLGHIQKNLDSVQFAYKPIRSTLARMLEFSSLTFPLRLIKYNRI